MPRRDRFARTGRRRAAGRPRSRHHFDVTNHPGDVGPRSNGSPPRGCHVESLLPESPRRPSRHAGLPGGGPVRDRKPARARDVFPPAGGCDRHVPQCHGRHRAQYRSTLPRPMGGSHEDARPLRGHRLFGRRDGAQGLAPDARPAPAPMSARAPTSSAPPRASPTRRAASICNIGPSSAAALCPSTTCWPGSRTANVLNTARVSYLFFHVGDVELTVPPRRGDDPAGSSRRGFPRTEADFG